MQSIAHAVVRLEQLNSDYGAARRRLVVVKYRGRDFRGGFHDYKIVRGGLLVFPRLVAAEHAADVGADETAERHRRAGCLAGRRNRERYEHAFRRRPGHRQVVGRDAVCDCRGQARRVRSAFIFDESINTLRTRCAGMGMNLQPHLDSGHIALRQIDPAELSPGELVHEIRQAVLKKKATVVIIDSLNGYLNAMPNEQFLIVQLHELLTFLGQAGVATLLIGAHHGLIGMQMQTPVDASYLADAVVLLRYFEADGMVRQAISVMKKRGGAHERSIRDFTLSETGIHVGPPLRQFRGILTGVPTVVDEPDRKAP